MKRRNLLRAAAAAPAAPILIQAPAAAQQVRTNTPAPQEVRLTASAADTVGETVVRFFSPDQMSALRRLSDVLTPSISGAPGAIASGAPEFLDFLVSQSGAELQQIYRAGLDALNEQARKRFNKSFADAGAAQAEALLAPLREPWKPETPADPLAQFLQQAKKDVRTATLNSREWAAASAASGGGRRFGGGGIYFLPLE